MKTKVLGILAGFVFLAGCSSVQSGVNSVDRSVHSTINTVDRKMFARPQLINIPLAVICAAANRNGVRADANYKGKAMELTGVIDDSLTPTKGLFTSSVKSFLVKTQGTHVRLSTSGLDISRLSNGQTISFYGVIDGLSNQNSCQISFDKVLLTAF